MRGAFYETPMRRRFAPSVLPMAKPVRCESELRPRYRGMDLLQIAFADSGTNIRTRSLSCIICFPFVRLMPSCPANWMQDLPLFPHLAQGVGPLADCAGQNGA